MQVLHLKSFFVLINKFNNPNEFETTYLIESLEELTTYRVKIEVEDNAGNIGTSEEIEFTTLEKDYVAQVIQIGDVILDTPIKYETVQGAIDHEECETEYLEGYEAYELLENIIGLYEEE